MTWYFDNWLATREIEPDEGKYMEVLNGKIEADFEGIHSAFLNARIPQREGTLKMLA
jgi:hypothetical protein